MGHLNFSNNIWEYGQKSTSLLDFLGCLCSIFLLNYCANPYFDLPIEIYSQNYVGLAFLIVKERSPPVSYRQFHVGMSLNVNIELILVQPERQDELLDQTQ